MKWILYLILVILATGLVQALGTCALDKEVYHPLEISQFICSCSTGIEKNQAGFIVFQNSTGDVLQANAVSSGDCINSFFGDSFTFPSGSDYLGNATFATNADGSGTPTNWDDGDDIISDNFNVSGAGALDCEITEITGVSAFALGEQVAIKISVEDGITTNPLVRASCIMDIYEVGEIPLHFWPYQAEREYMRSSPEGEVGFLGTLSAGVFQKNTTYEIEFHCFCINDTVEACYDETTGLDAGFKSCSTKTLITSSTDDNRGKDKYPQIFVLFTALPMILGIFFLVGAVSLDKNEHVAMKTALYLLSLMTFFMSMYIGLTSVSQFYEYTSLQESTTFIMWIVGVVLFIIISYFMMYLIVIAFKSAAEKRAARLRY